MIPNTLPDVDTSAHTGSALEPNVFKKYPEVPAGNLWSALAPLKIKSPLVVVGVVACPFDTKFQ